jgi:hypothetical protein
MFELLADCISYDCFDIGGKRFGALYLLTMIFNYLLLFGVSLSINLLLFKYGLIVLIFVIACWIALMSKIEIIIDEKLLIKGVK